jgi:beta-glucosidase/6-phospho-beta-glucosidase/beta-galactosidase
VLPVITGNTTTRYRLSIEWSRVQPQRPAWARDWIEARKDRPIADSIVVGQVVPGIGDEEPDPGAFDASEFDQAAIDHYREMIDLIDRGMEPIVTLNHMSLPDWVLKAPSKIVYAEVFFQTVNYSTVEDARFNGTLRGWETRATVAAYLRYVRVVVSALPKVRWWLTFNEPVSTMINRHVCSAPRRHEHGHRAR